MASQSQPIYSRTGCDSSGATSSKGLGCGLSFLFGRMQRCKGDKATPPGKRCILEGGSWGRANSLEPKLWGQGRPGVKAELKPEQSFRRLWKLPPGTPLCHSPSAYISKGLRWDISHSQRFPKLSPVHSSSRSLAIPFPEPSLNLLREPIDLPCKPLLC